MHDQSDDRPSDDDSEWQSGVDDVGEGSTPREQTTPEPDGRTPPSPADRAHPEHPEHSEHSEHPEQQGQQAQRVHPDEQLPPLEPGNPSLENAIFVLIGIVGTVLVFVTL